MSYNTDVKKLSSISRNDYIKTYMNLGRRMFDACEIPTAYEISQVTSSKKALDKLEAISSFTENTDELVESVKKNSALYTQEDSDKFINSVIASNITDITESGYFYKKLISSCDNMLIEGTDCGAKGKVYQLPIDENTFNYKIKYHYVVEINSYCESYSEFKKLTKNMDSVHVRTFLYCEQDTIHHRKFCPKCAGVFKRNLTSKRFIPKRIGLFSTLMITEHATQASLDSMNKGISEKVNYIIEENLSKEKFNSYEDVRNKIEEIIDRIGNVGVMSKYYEIALLSRFYKNADDSFTAASLQMSFAKQRDLLGLLIYKPTEKNFKKFKSSKNINASSCKSQLMLDIYD